MRLVAGFLLTLALAAGGAFARDAPPLALVRTVPLAARDLPAVPDATHRLHLDAVSFTGTRWRDENIVEAVRAAVALLGQCGIRTESFELYVFATDPEAAWLDTPRSRALARRLRLAKPAIFFVEDTRNVPAFDAEAFGRGNTLTRPELTDTVWVTADTRDLPITLAHELVHVLANSGAHSTEAGNLMRDETGPENTRLTSAQCAQILSAGEANGLLSR